MSDDLAERMDAFQRCIEDRDPEAAAGVLDPGYALVLVEPARAVMPRERWLQVLPDYVVHAYEVEEQVIDEDGDCAVVLQRVRMEATVLGQDRSGVFVLSDVWRKREGGWKLYRRHSTPRTAEALPGVAP